MAIVIKSRSEAREQLQRWGITPKQARIMVKTALAASIVMKKEFFIRHASGLAPREVLAKTRYPGP